MQQYDITPVNLSFHYKSHGFTLIELLIAVAIIGILSAIALPAYNNYILKGKVKTAQADLVALSLNVENVYQRQLSYPTSTTATTAKTVEAFPGWSPAQKNDFKYELSSATTTGYTVKASGTSSGLSSCTLTLTHENERTASDGCHGTDATW